MTEEKKLRKLIGDYEPKKTGRFVVTFPEDFKLPQFLIRSAALPSYLNGEWEFMEITFFDLIGPSASQSLFKLINRYKHIDLKKNTENFLFSYTISTLDPVGQIVETWEIFVEKISYINFGFVNSESDYIKLVQLQVKPYNCVLKF